MVPVPFDLSVLDDEPVPPSRPMREERCRCQPRCCRRNRNATSRSWPSPPRAPRRRKPPPRPRSAAAQNNAAAAGQTIRVDLDRVDRLINLVGELVINQAMLSQSVIENDANGTSSINMGLEELQQLTREIQD